MSYKVNYIERKFGDSHSIESVFRRIADELSIRGISTLFQQLPYGNGWFDIFLNLSAFHAKSADIYHVTGHAHYVTFIVPRNKTVLTVHDLTILRHRKGFRRWMLKLLFFDLPARRAKYITAVSQNTKDELIKVTGCKPDKIRVIENPLLFEPETPARSFPDVRPTILQIGTAANKNLTTVLHALAGLECRLNVVGKLNAAQRTLLSETGVEYENHEALDIEQMKNAYRNSDIVAFCSTSEGFGLPIIEAQALGRPVITSKREPMRSVAGDGALFVDPESKTSIREGFLTIINDRSLRERLIASGYTNIERFRPAAVSAKYAALYEQVLNELNAT